LLFTISFKYRVFVFLFFYVFFRVCVFFVMQLL